MRVVPADLASNVCQLQLSCAAGAGLRVYVHYNVLRHHAAPPAHQVHRRSGFPGQASDLALQASQPKEQLPAQGSGLIYQVLWLRYKASGGVVRLTVPAVRQL